MKPIHIILSKIETEQIIQMANDLTQAIAAIFYVHQINTDPNEISEVETFNAQVELIQEEARLIELWQTRNSANSKQNIKNNEFGETE
jgi:septum formation inhibitor MinC